MSDGTLFQVEIDLEVAFLSEGAPATLEFKQQHIMQVVEEMAALEDSNAAYADSDLGADFTTGRVTARMAVYASSLTAAVSEADGWIRSAIHAAGGFTPAWGSAQQNLAPTYREVSSSAHLVDA
jgi:hypothetical protein